MRGVQRLILPLAAWVLGHSASVVSAQTIQCQSMVFVKNSPCDPRRCLLTHWNAIVPKSQTLTYAVELSTNGVSWQEATTPLTLTQSTNIDVWVTADTPVGFIRLRIIE